ncbi:hypothetical protein QBC35DRAFT_374514 [Podospora australis]|uniref:Uncharacterized protein n=1 Tax=Podospora australis TaxID=1536484 RepID=A0AAN6X0Y4_9PEZI|nr:hypothetical protein QBC35DRAFT_374514 [Podospora australis]
MDKKLISLLEDHSTGSESTVFRPSSPLRFGRVSGNGSGGRGGGGSSSSSSTSSPQFHSRNTFDQSPSQEPIESCVSKETSQEDCARQRFIVWAAVKRNESLRRHPEKKLECPLLKCNKKFENHELMLKHLASCDLLTAGEYWCYDHMRVERFDDIKCKRCLGHQSKRKKIVTVAKKIFHSLGHKSKKAPTFGLEDDEQLLMPPPPSYESIDLLQPLDATELPSTEILEADSVEVPIIQAVAPVVPVVQPAVQPTHSLPMSDGAIDPQDLLISEFTVCLPELDSTMMNWQPDSFMDTHIPLQFEDDISGNPAYRPMLHLATNELQQRRPVSRPTPRPAPAVPRSKALSPSSSVRSTASTDSNTSTATTNSALTDASTISHGSTSSNGSSLVSPISSYSGAWSTVDGSDAHMASPMEGLMMVDENFCDSMINYNDACAGPHHDFIAELSGDFPIPKSTDDDLAALRLPEFEAPVSVNFAYAPVINLTEAPVELLAIEEPEDEQTDSCCSDTQALVSSAWDTLQEHIISSMVKMRDVQNNPLATHLSSMSIRTIATVGLAALRGLLNGRPPSTANGALCLVHLVYAFSLVLHEQEVSHRFKDLYLQSLSYTHSLPPADRDYYRQLAVLIWQPPDLNNSVLYNQLLSNNLTNDPKGKLPEMLSHFASVSSPGDSLLSAARDFLDELEISLVMGPDFGSSSVPTSVLQAKHHQDVDTTGLVNKALSMTVESVLKTLSVQFNTPKTSIHPRLNDILSRVNHGTISSVRRIEIELLCAGRECLSKQTFYNIYNPAIRELCDHIYGRHDTGTMRRNMYHDAGISLIESLIPVIDTSSPPQTLPLTDEPSNNLQFAGQSTHTTGGMTDDFENFLNFGASTTPIPTTDLNINDLTASNSTLAATSPIATSSNSGSSSPALDGKPFHDNVSTSLKTEQSPVKTTPEEQVFKASEADSCCDECGYRPKGDPQWFKGSMAKHKKLQHSKAPPRIYKCPYPGCTSQYKNRPDNLRQHQLEKNHFAQGEDVAPRRPSKRKKTAAEE